MKMKKYFVFMFLSLIIGCKDCKNHDRETIVNCYIDSICECCSPIRNGRFEHIKVDEYVMRDTICGKWKMWEFADSLAKYSNEEELKDLAINHRSVAIRYVSFRLLLKKDPHKAIEIMIQDINNKDSVVATRLDQGFPESLSNLRVELALSGKVSNISVEDSIAIDSVVMHSGMIDDMKKIPQ